MPTLRMQVELERGRGHGGEVFSCAFTPDSASVLSGGWDGQLRIWETKTGKETSSIAASNRPITACAIGPDGRRWASGSLDGLLSYWDPLTHRQISTFSPHARPISAIVFGRGDVLATAAWDRNIVIWDLERERAEHTFSGHEDIVAGCRFTPSGKMLASWSHDGTIRLWDLTTGRPQASMVGHSDRITAGAISPDGNLLATGSRDCSIRLWDLEKQKQVASTILRGEIRTCTFLLDSQYLVVADALGDAILLTAPGLKETSEVSAGYPVQCGELSPSGKLLALGCNDGLIRLVEIDGFDASPLHTTATANTKRTATRMQKFFGSSTVTQVYNATCPVCRTKMELSEKNELVACTGCKRQLRLTILPSLTE